MGQPRRASWSSPHGGWCQVAFYLYLTEIASYDSVFGSLASVIVAMGYLYISTTAFLFGAQLDAIIRSQATGALSGIVPKRASTSLSAAPSPGAHR